MVLAKQFVAIAGLLALVLIVACGGDSTTTQSPDSPIRLNLGGEPNTLDPQLASSRLEISVLRQLSQGLLGFDQDLNLTPLVASAVPTVGNGGITADGLIYTFKLKDGVTWSDGQPLTAGDFEYTFKRILSPDIAGPYSAMFTAIKGGEDYLMAPDAEQSIKDSLRDNLGINAASDDTLVITLVAPNPTFLQKVALVAGAPVRQDVVEQFGAAWTEAGNHVGNGPYVLTEWVHQDHITLEANAKYWGQAPMQNTIQFSMITDVNAELTAYKAGDLDIAQIPPGTESGILGDANLSEQVLAASQLTSLALFLNLTVEPFDDPMVRRAIATGIDRSSWTEKVKNGVGESATGWLPPGLPGYDASVGSAYDFNASEARSMLAEAGYPEGEGFPDISLTYVEAGDQGLMAQFLQAQLLENLGINMGLTPLDPPSYGQQVIGGRQFGATLLAWSADYPDPENFLAGLFASDSFLDITGYASEEFDRLAGMAAAELDQKIRIDLWDQAHQVMIADAPIAPFMFVEQYFLMSPNVHGLTLTGVDGAIPGDTRLAEVYLSP
ncbi:MAG: peptide ABC transporter substrate-binding protein [SAR202 cluster bacterium]|nr:peptide ABC transporter substrate-binding protein [SAR202 cluster bacterium]